MLSFDTITSTSNGATFFRGDLHIHSFGASYDVSDTTATPEAIVATAAKEDVSIIALADHNEILNVRRAVEAGILSKILVIPGVELSTPEGHLLCYAPTPDALERFFNRLTIADRGTPTCRCQTSTLQCLDLIQNEGGFGILAHIESNGAFEANLPRFTPAKLDIVCHPALEAIEVTRADCPITYTADDPDTDRRAAAAERTRRLKLGTQQFLGRVLNSDAHTLAAVGRNASQNRRITRYKMETPSFEGLRLALKTADTRVRIEDELPSSVPYIEGVHFRGAFLDGEAVNFSPNLTCIIGGRGSGKSTMFEALCLAGGASSQDVNVIDSDVWPDSISLLYRDETNKSHRLERNKNSDFENIDDPVSGLLRFSLESYRQGATNDISRKVHDDPLALLNFLDRLISVEDAIEREDEFRAALAELWPEIAKASSNVAKIPNFERELKHKTDQLQRLGDDKGEAIIKLQQRLEGEKRTRLDIEQALGRLASTVTTDPIIQVIGSIKEAANDEGIQIGASEAARIRSDTETYENSVAKSNDALRSTTTQYTTGAHRQIDIWKEKERATLLEIEQKKKELLSHGIRLDMTFIQRLVADEARAKQNVKNLKTWIPELARLKAEYNKILDQRWAARREVGNIRTAFAVRASKSLKAALSDLFVTLKFETNALSPDAERLITDAMGWRTLQHLKARALINKVTLPALLDCVRRKDADCIIALRNENGAPVFSSSEAQVLLERLCDPELLSQLETVAIYDLPRLNVTKRLDTPGTAPRFVPRDFKRLSLGQQQSVLLALMLTSESRAPLIVDQPEDNLDSEFIYKTLVPVIRSAKERRQVVVVTHNANIAVLGDAELIVTLKATNDKATIVCRGSIDHAETCDLACAILEGSREAFDRRATIYGLHGRSHR